MFVIIIIIVAIAIAIVVAISIANVHLAPLYMLRTRSPVLLLSVMQIPVWLGSHGTSFHRLAHMLEKLGSLLVRTIRRIRTGRNRLLVPGKQRYVPPIGWKVQDIVQKHAVLKQLRTHLPTLWLPPQLPKPPHQFLPLKKLDLVVSRRKLALLVRLHTLLEFQLHRPQASLRLNTRAWLNRLLPQEPLRLPNHTLQLIHTRSLASRWHRTPAPMTPPALRLPGHAREKRKRGSSTHVTLAFLPPRRGVGYEGTRRLN